MKNFNSIKARIQPSIDKKFLTEIAHPIYGGYNGALYTEKLIRKAFPKAEKKLSRNGFVWMPVFSPEREVSGVDLMEPLEPLYRSGYDLGKATADHLLAFSTLMVLEHKIHLMPKPEYKMFVLKRLFAAIKSDEEFRLALYSGKVHTDELSEEQISGTDDDPVMPSIVLYCSLGMANAITCLRKITDLFSDCDELVGIGVTPRGNLPVGDSKLVFYALGSFDIKWGYNKVAPLYPEVPQLDANFLFFLDGGPTVLDLYRANGSANIPTLASELEPAEAALEQLKQLPDLSRCYSSSW